MKKILLFLFLFAGFGAWAQDIPSKPNPPKLVNDFTGTLTAQQAQTLEQKLYEFDNATSNQITVVIVKTTGGEDVADYALELGRKWGVGQKDNNNGVVLLIAKDDRHLNISPGYGLEKALPDVTCKQIIDYTIVPQFKGDDYYSGINLGIDEIIKATKGEYKAPEGYNKRKGKGGGLGRIIFIIIIIVIFLAVSGGSSGGGGFMSRRGFAAWTIGNMIGGGGGGGGWSGGGGGSSGGGGFGGFGGGSFGGGGASGSW